MIGQKIKQLRLSKGWTMDELVARIGGIVTKQAVSKYELGLIQPSLQVLTKMANAFDVKTIHFISQSKYKVEFIAYRKRCDLPAKEQVRIENLTRERFQERLYLQDVICVNSIDVPVQKFAVNSLDDAENAANKMREHWNLGKDQISSITSILENHLVHLFEIQANEKFDGIAAVAYKDAEVRGAAIVVRGGITGDRQRLNLAHELGHVVLKVDRSVDEEKAAFRFGSAFLAPREWVLREVGGKRTSLNSEELFILKKKLGMSIQAILYRLKDLEVITETYFTHCFRVISELGWKKVEPNPLPLEKPEWLKQNVYKAFAEGLLSQKDAERLLKEKIEEKVPLSLQTLRSLMKLPMEERRRILAEHSLKAEFYNKHPDDPWQSGDFSEQSN